MKIAGIIAEYNPFHRGHEYHIRETRRRTGCDYVVACMTGSFTQRGEAACLSKQARARMALLCGADAVLELPALFAVRTADAFARGGVGVLGGVGVDVLSFGSETEDMDRLAKLAALRADEPYAVSEAVRRNLALGMSHARAQGAALADYLGAEPEALNRPNAILGAEYLRAIGDLRLSMEAVAIRRIGGYHDPMPDGEQTYASASAIRRSLPDEAALRAVPAAVRDILAGAEQMHAPDDLLLYKLRGMSEARLRALPDVSEGLERRVVKCAQSASTAQALIDAVKCKRYTRARLSRLMAHAMLDLTAELAARHSTPHYARLIGMRMDAAPLVRELKARARLPLVSDVMALADDEVFRLECRATDLRALMCDEAVHRRAGQEFTAPFVRV